MKLFAVLGVSKSTLSLDGGSKANKMMLGNSKTKG